MPSWRFCSSWWRGEATGDDGLVRKTRVKCAGQNRLQKNEPLRVQMTFQPKKLSRYASSEDREAIEWVKRGLQVWPSKDHGCYCSLRRQTPVSSWSGGKKRCKMAQSRHEGKKKKAPRPLGQCGKTISPYVFNWKKNSRIFLLVGLSHQITSHPASMWDRQKRALLLWVPIIWILGTTFWLRRLRRAQAMRVFEARERLLLQGEDVDAHPDNNKEENAGYNAERGPQYKLHHSEVMQPLLITVVSLSRKIVLWVLVLNMISNEIAYLYCKGHTGTYSSP